jgi:hypothetical protein
MLSAWVMTSSSVMIPSLVMTRVPRQTGIVLQKSKNWDVKKWNLCWSYVCFRGYQAMSTILLVRFPAEVREFSSNLCVQTGSGVHPASCPIGTGGVISSGVQRGRGVTLTTPISCRGRERVEAIYPFLPCATIGVVWDCFCFYYSCKEWVDLFAESFLYLVFTFSFASWPK